MPSLEGVPRHHRTVAKATVGDQIFLEPKFLAICRHIDVSVWLS
jgi:hypothetical protein